MKQLRAAVGTLTNMPALSVIPFILHLMIPVPPAFQEHLQAKYFSNTLTPRNLDSIDSLLTFTTKLGKGKLPSPLYAQLERSMSNNAIIYHQYHDKTSNTIKKAYLYVENCAGRVLLTEDDQKATTFQIRNEDDDLHGSNFHISCLRTTTPSPSTASSGHGSPEMNTDNSDSTGSSSSEWIKLAFTSSGNYEELIVEDSSVAGSSISPLIGVISPYYMQQFTS